jgi:hypothetical protein
VVSSGGKFIEPAHYSSARLELKEGEVTAWFHLPGRPAPEIPAAPVPPAAPAGDPPPTADTAAGHADDVEEVQDFQEVQEFSDFQDAKGDDPADAPGARYTVHGDMSQHHDNVYQQPVHIGRITGDAGRRKG